MSSAPWRACALGLSVALALLTVVGILAPSRAETEPVEPRAAMTVTVVLDKASYLSGDTVIANAIVYRTPVPGNYTYAWEVRDFPARLVNTTLNGTATLRYVIPLNYTGTLLFDATVDDGQGLAVTSRRSATVSVAVLSIRLDRGAFNPGETINAFYSVSSHVILRPTYEYEVDDSSATIVLSGTTNNSSFSFKTPNPASRTYTFLVTAREDENSTQGVVTISQVSGIVLGVTFDKLSYTVGETVHAHLTLTAKGTTALPNQFDWSLTFGPAFSSAGVSAITSVPEVDLSLPVPLGLGTGDVLVFASEQRTGTAQFQTIHIGATNTLWSTEIGGIPLFAVLLGLLFILLLVAVLGLWRRITVGGPLLVPGPALPPPPEEPVRTIASAPMSVICAHCGKSIELTTSKRPIEVMCPSCGETQLVA